jgi:acetolactate synthase-1/2/3 large subunit
MLQAEHGYTYSLLLTHSLLVGSGTEGAHSGLHAAGVVAALTGAILYCENAFARIDRGAGRPMIRRLPYFPEDARR